jgi:hypothetical protein
VKELRTRSVMARDLAGYVVCVHSEAAPSDEEWEGILRLFTAAVERGRLAVIVHTKGGAPNARQRARLNEILRGGTPRIAVMSSSAVVRAAATAISWFNPLFRLFPPEGVEAALDHLEIKGLERESVSRALVELKSDLFGGARRTAGH